MVGQQPTLLAAQRKTAPKIAHPLRACGESRILASDSGIAYCCQLLSFVRPVPQPSAPKGCPMSTRAEQFAGLSVAIVTPFRDGAVDVPRLHEQIGFQVEAGVTAICPVGTTGESPTLTHDEHQRVIAESIQAAAGKIRVMPGTGSNSTAEAIRLTQYAEKAGADAALVVGPYYNRPTQQGIYEHFKALAEAVSIPICVYNIPGRTGRNIEPETIDPRDCRRTCCREDSERVASPAGCRLPTGSKRSSASR